MSKLHASAAHRLGLITLWDKKIKICWINHEIGILILQKVRGFSNPILFGAEGSVSCNTHVEDILLRQQKTENLNLKYSQLWH